MTRNINLFTSFYNDKDPNRAAELRICLRANAVNKDFNKVILLNNPRPTYMDFFVETKNYPDDINIIANTDIYFDETINLLREISSSEEEFKKVTGSHPNNVCFALTRWDNNGRVERFVDRGSQDVWVFFGSVQNLDKLDASYTLGTPGCDNRIARELHDAGYNVYNPSESIRTIHLHTSNIRNYDERDTIFGEHLLIDSCCLNTIKDTKHYLTTKEMPEGFEPKPKVQEYVPNNPFFRNKIKPEIKPVEPPKPRILHVALSPGDNGLTKAFKKASSEYSEIDWGKIYRTQGKSFTNVEIIKRVEEFKPDLVFMQTQTDGLIHPDTIQKIAAQTFVMHWGGDKRVELPEYYTSIAPYVNVTACTCMEDVKKMRQNGWNAEFLQIGFDPEIYRPALQPVDSCPPIIFTGSNYGNQFPLSVLRTQMYQFLRAEYGEKFQAYGNGWPHNLPYLDQHSEARHFNTAKIAINLNHFNSLRYTSDRLFRIMGSGAFCLSFHYDGIEQDFKPGVHLDTFKNLHELLTKINHYLQNDATRNQIAMNGKNLVHAEYTFDKMIDNILKVYNKYKK